MAEIIDTPPTSRANIARERTRPATERSTLIRELDHPHHLYALIEELSLDPLHVKFLRYRWLAYVTWLDRQARRSYILHRFLRTLIVIGGVLTPALVSLNLGEDTRTTIMWPTFAVGVVVAVSVALDELFQFGDNWTHYRRIAEMLKSEGWRFFQRSEPYRRYSSHQEAFPRFADRVEAIVQQEVDTYFSRELESEMGAQDSVSVPQSVPTS